MTTTYNYTGHYAIQVNYVSGTAFTTHEYSNIPGNSMAYPGSSFDVILSVQDLKTSDSVSLTLTTAYNAVEIVSINAILYYQVHFLEIGKTQLNGFMFNVQGNVQAANFGGSFSYKSSAPISAYQHIYLGFYSVNKSICHLITPTWQED